MTKINTLVLILVFMVSVAANSSLLALVCEGAAFIYVLAGGYSPDVRRRYIIMPMVIMWV